MKRKRAEETLALIAAQLMDHRTASKPFAHDPHILEFAQNVRQTWKSSCRHAGMSSSLSELGRPGRRPLPRKFQGNCWAADSADPSGKAKEGPCEKGGRGAALLIVQCRLTALWSVLATTQIASAMYQPILDLSLQWRREATTRVQCSANQGFIASSSM